MTHTHDWHLEESGPPSEQGLWDRDNVVLTSVGIDVGSATTQVVFTRLHLRRAATPLSTRFVVVDRTTLHEAEPAFTPFTGDMIDAPRLGSLVDEAYASAGLEPTQIDTGIVILTGEALRRRNARPITQILSARAGSLVTASAGHHMEARLAAHGSGSVQRSRELHGPVLNIDIGGGTTKFTVVHRGRIQATAALHVGGRLLVVDDAQVVTRLERAAVEHAARVGVQLELGGSIDGEALGAITRQMVDVLLAFVGGHSHALVAPFLLTQPIGLSPAREIVLSGGVARYLGLEGSPNSFSDLGPFLAAELRSRLTELPGPVKTTPDSIRATVRGAAQFSVQVSGSTSWITDPDRALPVRDLLVLRPDVDAKGDVDVVALERLLLDAGTSTRADGEHRVLLALPFDGEPSHTRLHALARTVVGAITHVWSDASPVYVAVERDVARSLGRMMQHELGLAGPLVVLDGVWLEDFDYVDLGRVRQPSGTVTVTVKSLVFEADPPDSQGAVTRDR